jgi:adenosylmethionine-8-amino-7-oxononanoate aminotransferase
MSHIIHRSLRATPPVASRGEGVYLFDQQGKRYLDASGGAAVSCLGHAHPDVLAAMHAQVDALAYAHTSFFTSAVAEELADQLARTAPPGLTNVYFVSGGSEGMEAALKLARQHFVERGQPQRTKFIARRQSYHGNTLGALAVGGNEWRRKQFAPLLIDVLRVAPCYAYRDQRAGETEAQYTQRLLDEIERIIIDNDPTAIIGFCAETVVGATAGAVPPTADYFKGVRALCDKYGILWLADEVMCGMGRCGTLYAVEQEGATPDMVVIAKGLGGGYQPIGALLTSDFIVDPLRSGSGLFQHGHTYLGHPMACAASLAVQRVIEKNDLLSRVRSYGANLKKSLQEKTAQHAHVGDVRGRGLFIGVELVRDRATKTPFDPDLKLHAKIKAQCFANGLLCYPMGGTIDGRHGDHVLLAPPFIVNDEHVQFIAETLIRSIDQVLAKETVAA